MKVIWICSALPDADGPLSALRCLTTLAVMSTGAEAIDQVRQENFDSVVLDTPVENWATEDLLGEIRLANPRIPVLIRTRTATLEDAIRLTRLGAFHYFDHSTSSEQLLAFLETARDLAQANQTCKKVHLAAEPWRQLLIGSGAAIQDVIESIRLLARRRCTILIQGETGTGKELVARALHMASHRANVPMVSVNCSALPDTLLEAELFGHVRGAFTGAITQRVGRFEQAHNSSLFLDEIADMPADVQTKLLRVLQEREFQRLGSSETIKVDVRVLAACNVNLEERVRQGRFREDLYYRLNVVPIEIPPLRKRLDDIPMLVRHFVAQVAAREGLPLKQLSRETMELLMRYRWPGNVRQLENAVEMAMIMSGDREMLHPRDFRLPFEGSHVRASMPTMSTLSLPEHGLNFEQTVGQLERTLLEQALHRSKGNKKQAAEMLGLKRTTLSAKLKSLDALAG